jgi:hypothetical protein
MRVCVLAAMAAGLLFASDDQKQGPAGELAELTILEKQVWDAWKNQNQGILQSLLREDYVQISGPGPERMTKGAMLKALPQTRITDYTLEDVRLVQLNPEAAILTYKLTLKGLLADQGLFANPAYVTSIWAHKGMAWLSVFRQWTPLSKGASSPPRITTFETALTPNSIRSLYKGTTKLEDIHATLNIALDQGSVTTHTFWGSWEPGEIKEINLGFLAFGVATVQRIELSGSATMAGKQVLIAATSRRDVK